jgi:hypothetical protein
MTTALTRAVGVAVAKRLLLAGTLGVTPGQDQNMTAADARQRPAAFGQRRDPALAGR